MATGEITCLPWATVLTVDMVTSSYLWAVAWTMAIEVTNHLAVKDIGQQEPID